MECLFVYLHESKHAVDVVRVGDMHSGLVHRYGNGLNAHIHPAAHIFAHRFKDEHIYIVYHADSLGDRDKFIGADIAENRVLPACKRLGGDAFSRFQIVFGLYLDSKLIVLENGIHIVGDIFRAFQLCGYLLVMENGLVDISRNESRYFK